MKQNLLEDVWKFFSFVMTGIITLMLVSVGSNIWKNGKETAEHASRQLNDYSIYIQEADVMKYDGLDVTGSDVINFIKKYLGEYTDAIQAPFTVTVSSAGKAIKHSNNNYIKHITNFSHETYIKPTASFKGSVIKNQNGVILDIKFAQQ